MTQPLFPQAPPGMPVPVLGPPAPLTPPAPPVQPAPPPDALPAVTPQLQIAQATQDLAQTAGALPVPLTAATVQGATPRQALADTLNLTQKQRDLATKQGDIEVAGAAEEAKARAQTDADNAQKIADDQTARAAAELTAKQEHDETQAAYKKFRDTAGSLKDPQTQFFEDRGQYTRITSALAAAASGLGAGLLGHAGNPFLDYLNKQIDGNYQAHKQNIDDLYKAAVESGHIEDTTTNKARFDLDAKRYSDDLQRTAIKDHLATVAANTNNQAAKLIAQKAILGLDQQDVADRAKFTHDETVRNAAAAAQQRAREKEIGDAYEKALTRHKEEFDTPEENRQAAAADVYAQFGKNTPGIGAFAERNGVVIDPKTGGPLAAPPRTGPAPGITFDATGEPTIPRRNPLTRKPYSESEIKRATQEHVDRSTYENTKDDLQGFLGNVKDISPSLIEGLAPTSRQKTQEVQADYKKKVEQIVQDISKSKGQRVPQGPALAEAIKEYIPRGSPGFPGSYEDEAVTKSKIEKLINDYNASVGVRFGGNPGSITSELGGKEK